VFPVTVSLRPLPCGASTGTVDGSSPFFYRTFILSLRRLLEGVFFFGVDKLSQPWPRFPVSADVLFCGMVPSSFFTFARPFGVSNFFFFCHVP